MPAGRAFTVLCLLLRTRKATRENHPVTGETSGKRVKGEQAPHSSGVRSRQVCVCWRTCPLAPNLTYGGETPMCGIVGYIGFRNATPIIVSGLEQLEYRGYDSAGIAVLQDGCIEVRRDVGKLANLRARLATHPASGSVGIGHTRWATHGVPAERNSHPHISMDGRFVVVHNGIVENYLELRQSLI